MTRPGVDCVLFGLFGENEDGDDKEDEEEEADEEDDDKYWLFEALVEAERDRPI